MKNNEKYYTRNAKALPTVLNPIQEIVVKIPNIRVSIDFLKKFKENRNKLLGIFKSNDNKSYRSKEHTPKTMELYKKQVEAWSSISKNIQINKRKKEERLNRSFEKVYKNINTVIIAQYKSQ